MEYIQLSFPVTGILREILIAQLSEAGCEGFEETDELLIASIPLVNFQEEMIRAIASDNGVEFTKELVEQQNWNAIWEAGFEPVVVPGFCTVRADFHPPARNTPYEIIITPKMSFGTGHHATTRLMMAAMKELELDGKRVLDFGTGTGILAILASKLGAAEIIALDNDEWSVENAKENAQANAANNIQVLQGAFEAIVESAPFDVILANINRHVLLDYMSQMHSTMNNGGVLLLSGILKEDEAIIVQVARDAGLNKVLTNSEGDWIALKFTA